MGFKSCNLDFTLATQARHKVDEATLMLLIYIADVIPPGILMREALQASFQLLTGLDRMAD